MATSLACHTRSLTPKAFRRTELHFHERAERLISGPDDWLNRAMSLRRLCWAMIMASAAGGLAAAPAPTAAEAEQVRIIQAMSERLRARIDALPVLIAADVPVGKIEERTVTLNRDAVVVDGQRFDAVVVVAPRAQATFAWAFVTPANSASWYIVRERGEMKGFANFLRRPRTQVPFASTLKPTAGTDLTFQKLDAAAWSPGERYLLWFRFKDDAPAEFTLRAGFFARASLNNNALPALLFPLGAARPNEVPTPATKF